MLPSFASAQSVWKEFELPTGVKFWAIRVIEKAKASELSLREEIILFIKAESQEKDLPENKVVAIANCESRLNPKAYNPDDVDGRPKYGLFQFDKNTYVGKDIWDWKEQTRQATDWMEKGYWRKWPVCNKTWKKYQVGG